MESKVTQCYQRCPFFFSSMDGMECVHPVFKELPAYSGMIITHENSKGGKIPDKCPLRKETLTYKLEINGK